MITMIAALAENRAIGVKNQLPWHLPLDMQRFRAVTKGHTVVMGRKTFESIVASVGGPLPGRRNVVLTRSSDFAYEGVSVIHEPKEVLDMDEDVDVIGGAQIYELFLGLADRLDLTEVHTTVDGDAFFPEFDPYDWKEVSREQHTADADHAYDFDFVLYERTQV
jgi:dihydrofolate reductase